MVLVCGRGVKFSHPWEAPILQQHTVTYFWCNTLHVSRLNEYVKAEYYKKNTPCSTFQILKLFTCLRFQKAFKTAAGCYFEPWTNVFRSLCTHFLFTDNSFDFWFYSSETFAKSFDYFAILSSRNEPFPNIRSLHEGLGWVYREWSVGLYAWV